MDQLKATLANGTSNQVQVRTKALELLLEWEIQPNFYASLQAIFMDNQIDVKIRHLAVISLKNGIAKYWRKGAKGAIQDQEKASIKENQLNYLHEPNQQLAIQHAVVTSKIARFDFPRDWPDLLDRLIPLLEKCYSVSPSIENYPIRFNSLYTLHLIMKALTTKTLPLARKMTFQLTPQVFKFVFSLYCSQMEVFAQSNPSQPSDPELSLQAVSIARIALKCLRRLVINGYQKFSDSEEVRQMFGGLVHYLPNLLVLRTTLQKSPILRTVENMIILIGKICVDSSHERVIDFVLVPACVPLSKVYYSFLQKSAKDSTNGQIDEFLVNIQIQAIKIFKNVAYHQDFNIISDQNKDERLKQALDILESSLFTRDFIFEAIQLLISQFLVMDNEALDQWENDPEEFIIESESDQWEFNLRSCAEKLIMVLLTKNKTLVCPFLIDTLSKLPPTDNSRESVLFREAVYCVISISPHDLSDYLAFDDFFLSKLVPESKMDLAIPEWNLIRRRIALILSSWVGVKSSPQYRSLIYDILLSFMKIDDLVVQMTAVSALRVVLDDFEFDGPTFHPYLHAFTERFMVLLGQVDEFDSKIKIIQALIVVIERMEGQVIPSIAPLVDILPQLWTRSEGQNLFKASIVTIMTKLVKSLRGNSVQLMPMILPVLQSSLDTSNPGHLYLLEEGLDLWLSTIQNCPTITPDLIQFIPFAIQQMEYGNESLKKVLHIIEAYVVLAPLVTLQSYSDPLVSSISKMMGSLTVSASNSLLRLVDLMCQSCQVAGCFPDLLNVMYTQGLFGRLLSVALGGEEMDVIVVGFLIVIFRLFLYDAPNVIKIIESGGPGTFSKFMGIALEKYDSLGHIRQRKLFSLGLLALVGTGHDEIRLRMMNICTILTSIAIEVENIDRSHSMLFTFDTRDGDDDEDSLDFARRKKLHSVDLLYNHSSFPAFLLSQIQSYQAKTNVSILDQLAQQDPEIASQMKRILEASSRAATA